MYYAKYCGRGRNGGIRRYLGVRQVFGVPWVSRFAVLFANVQLNLNPCLNVSVGCREQWSVAEIES